MSNIARQQFPPGIAFSMMDGGMPEREMVMMRSLGSGSAASSFKEPTHVRKHFPETWLWKTKYTTYVFTLLFIYYISFTIWFWAFIIFMLSNKRFAILYRNLLNKNPVNTIIHSVQNCNQISKTKFIKT